MRQVTRRVALGAGVMAAGGAGAVVVGQTGRGRRWLHTVGVVRGPDLDPPDADIAVDAHELDSRHLRRSVRWLASSPTRHTTALLLCLHGRNEDERFAFDVMGVHRFVADAALPWVVVGVDGGESSYWHQRADGTDAQAMIFEELLPTLDKAVGELPLGIVGWSMGGYGALVAASEHDEVAAVAAASPALWRTFDASSPGAFDSPEDFSVHDVFRHVDVLARVPVRVDCGADDPFIDMDRELATAIDAEHDFGPGFHDAASWRSRIPAQLEFLARHLDV